MTNQIPGPAASNQDKLAGLDQPTPAPSPPPTSGVPPWEGKATEPAPRYSPLNQAVANDRSPWTSVELASAQTKLESEKRLLAEEIATAEAGRAQLEQEGYQAIEDEVALARNARDMLEQIDYALARIQAGTYGHCEWCGEPIGKYRLQSFPRATLCKPCKEAEEMVEAQEFSQVTAAFGSASGVESDGFRGRSGLPRPSPLPNYTSPQLRNGKGTAALVCGILGLVPFPITGFWLSLVAIILGWQGYKRCQRGEATNQGVAIAGFVLGIIGMGIQLLLSLAIAFS